MRCFIAVVFSDEHDSQITSIQSNVTDTISSYATLDPTNHFHITLSFLGDIPDDQVDMLASQITNLKCKAMTLETNNILLFPNKQHPRVVSLGFTKNKQSEDLAKTQLLIKSALISQIKKVKTSKQSFIPHITLFRIKKLHSGTKELAQACHSIPLDKLKLKTQKLVLFKSTLHPDGPIYESIAEVEFK